MSPEIWSNLALNLALFGRWAPRDKAAQVGEFRRSAE